MYNIENLKEKFLFQMTGDEFLFLQRQGVTPSPQSLEVPIEPKEETTYAYGIDGIASIFRCSRATASRIKASGLIDKAITQVGRKIVVNVDLARKLAKQSKTNRR